jgi:hypothetical protein
MHEAESDFPKLANAGRTWSEPDDELLKQSLRHGATPVDIAVTLKRNLNDVFERLAALAIKNQHSR